MKTLLQLNTSLFSHAGHSSRLADRFVAGWRAANPGAKVVVRDLAADPVPHITAERFQSFTAKAGARTAGQAAVVAYSDSLIDELKRADVIVLALPMYNFGVPSTLKAYFDHIARAGVTFKYTAQGAVGLLNGKKAYVFAARGGLYAGTKLDTETSYVSQFLAFLGIGEVQFVHAEGLAISEETRDKAVAAANAEIDALTNDELRAAA